MSAVTPRKVFWKEVGVTENHDGFGVALDGRPLKTPAKALLNVPTRAMAEAIADEWRAQDTEIDPLSMPATRGANAAIDKVTAQKAEVADMLAEYGATDLVCYRAAHPVELIERQAKAWDPVLDWVAAEFDAPLVPVSGVMHVAQDDTSLARLRAHVHEMDVFQLAGFHDLVSLSGSLAIGLAATRGFATPEELWNLSRVDEIWQEEQWGGDEEASELAQQKRDQFLSAHKFFHMSSD